MPQQIVVLPTKVVKSKLQKNAIIQLIKHAFVWGIVYKQGVVNMSVRIHRKENVKVLMKNWLVRFRVAFWKN
jgi:hypothetical protein